MSTSRNSSAAAGTATRVGRRRLRDPRADDERDRRWREAFGCLTRTIPAPHPAWRYHDTSRGKFRPWAGTGFEMIRDAMHAGAPEADVWPMVIVLADEVQAFYHPAEDLDAIAQAETDAQGPADSLVQRALRTRCVSSLVAAERAMVMHAARAWALCKALVAARRAAGSGGEPGLKVWR